MPFDAERFTPGEARIYLEGVMENQELHAKLLDTLALRIMSALNPEAANELGTRLDLMERKRRSE